MSINPKKLQTGSEGPRMTYKTDNMSRFEINN
jgi:hypothetical protein